MFRYGIVFIVGLLLMLAVVGCEKRVHQVRYEVSGTVSAIDIRYRNATSGAESRTVSSGWIQSYEIESYEWVNLWVSTGSETGTVSCKIFVDGELVSTAEAEGRFKSATCSNLITPPTPTPSSYPSS